MTCGNCEPTSQPQPWTQSKGWSGPTKCFQADHSITASTSNKRSLTYLILLNLTIHFICRDVNEPLDVADTSHLEQDMGTHHIVHGEIVRITKRVIDMRLSSEMHDRVDVTFIHDKADEIWNGDVALTGSA